jgi:hypothetical protein
MITENDGVTAADHRPVKRTTLNYYHYTTEMKHTPNWPKGREKDKFTRIRITVQLDHDGAGFSRERAERICEKIEKVVSP